MVRLNSRTGSRGRAQGKKQKRPRGSSRKRKKRGAPGFSTGHGRSRRKAAAPKTGGSAEVLKVLNGAGAEGKRTHNSGCAGCFFFWEFRLVSRPGLSAGRLLVF